MKQINSKINDLLYGSLDAEPDAAAKKKLETALEQSEVLRNEKNFLLQQRGLLEHCSDDVSFKPFFAERIMQRIHASMKNEYTPDAFCRTMFVFFKRFALAGIAGCLVILGYNFLFGDGIKAVDLIASSNINVDSVLHFSFF